MGNNSTKSSLKNSGIKFLVLNMVCRYKNPSILPMFIKSVAKYYVSDKTVTKHTLRYQGSRVSAVCFSPRGEYLLTKLSFGFVFDSEIINIRTGECKARLANDHGCKCMAYSPCGNFVVTDDYRGLRILNVGQRLRYEMRNIQLGYTRCMEYSPDGKWLACGSSDKTIRIWDTRTWKCQKYLSGHIGSVFDLCFSPCGKFLASGSRNNVLRIWNLETGVAQKRFYHCESISAIRYSKCGNYLSMGVYSNVVVVCAKTGTTQYTLKGHKNNISCLCYSPDGRFLASSSWDGTIKLWDLSKQKCVRTFLEASEYGIFSRGLLAYSPCGNYIAGIHNNTWKIWELI